MVHPMRPAWKNKTSSTRDRLEKAVDLAHKCLPVMVRHLEDEGGYSMCYISNTSFEVREEFGMDELKWLMHLLFSLGSWKLMMVQGEDNEMVLFEDEVGEIDGVFEDDKVVKTFKEEEGSLEAVRMMLSWFEGDGKAYFQRRVGEKLGSILDDPVGFVLCAYGISTADVAQREFSDLLLKKSNMLQSPDFGKKKMLHLR